VTWSETNRAFLTREIERVKQRLEGTTAVATPFDEPAPALVVLQRLFGLTDFERDVIVMCAGAALEPASFPRPTFGAALATLDGAHLDASTPDAPLRSRRLVVFEHTVGGSLAAPLAIDDRVLYFLLGIDTLDERIIGARIPTSAIPPAPTPGQAVIVDRLAAILGDARVAVQLTGGSAGDRVAILCAAARRADLRPLRLRASALAMPDLAAFVAACDREHVLGRALVALEVDAYDGVETSRAVRGFVELSQCPVVILGSEPTALTRTSLHLDVPWPTSSERRALWADRLGARIDDTVDRIAEQFQFDRAAIDAALVCCDANADDETLRRSIWTSCLEQSRMQIDDLAVRIVPQATWDDLVLPDEMTSTLREIGQHLRHRGAVHETWGFARGNVRGQAITALFAGPSGTGKTLAAEVIARDVGLDLYHVDLSQVVDKYVGETEKRLRRIFDAAEQGGAILLFDEADALFGKRGEIERGTDRWANLEVSYLLQRMERYRGLAILTTNTKGAIDNAFLRRLRFVVRFPFPDALLRGALWRRAFPPDAPTASLDTDVLARLQLTGANIKTVALASAVQAAAEASPITMAHVVRAARREFAKLEMPFPEAELRAPTTATLSPPR
jgi:AAA+ superfamily predicted ATPase